MPRKNKAPEPPPAEGKPESAVTEPSSFRQIIPEFKSTKPITKRGLERVQQSIFNRHAEPMLEEIFAALRLRIRAGDPKAIQLGAEMHKLVGAKGNVNVNVQQNNQNEAYARSQAVASKGFDDLVRRLDSRDHQESCAADFITASPA